MKCPICGENIEGLSRCESCGTPVLQAENTPDTAINISNGQPASLDQNKSITTAEEQPAEYDFDSDLEFVDADSLLDDKQVSPAVKTEQPQAQPPDMEIGQSDSASYNPGQSENVIEGIRNAIQMDSPDENSGSSINFSGQSNSFSDTAENENIFSGIVSMDPKIIEPDSFTQDRPSAFQAEPLPSQPSIQIEQAADNSSIQPGGFGQSPQPEPSMNGIPASLMYQQRPQTPSYNDAALVSERQEPPAGEKHAFSSFVESEVPQQSSSNSPFIESRQNDAIDNSVYDFQPSIYYKQMSGENVVEVGYHKDDLAAQRADAVSSEDSYVPPSFARSLDKSDFHTAERMETPYRSIPVQKTFAPVIQKQRSDTVRKTDENDILGTIFKVIFVLLTLSSFFLMDVFATINSPLNPYDQHKSSRYLVLIFMVVITLISLFIKNLALKPALLIPLFISIAGLFLYGVTSLKIIIEPDKSGNFYVINPGPSINVVEDDTFDAIDPVISQSSRKAMFINKGYSSDTPLQKVELINFLVKNKKIQPVLGKTDLVINGNIQWFNESTAIYSDLKIELPNEMTNPVLMASRNELYFNFTSTFYIYNLDSRISRQWYQFSEKLPFSLFLKQILNKSENTILVQLSNIYTSPDKAEYRFVYNQKTGMIAACYMGGIWLIDPAKGISKKITKGGDLGSPFLDAWPQFSKDGKKVFFIRTLIGEKIENDILQVDAGVAINSDEPLLPVSVTNDPYDYLGFSLSPGDRFLAAWIMASVDSGAKINENALVVFDMKLNKQIKIFPLEQYDRTADQFVNNINWSAKGNYILFQLNRLLHSSIKRIDIPEAVYSIDH